MSENKKLTCPICGSKYDACISCERHSLASWKTVCDTENHFKIFTTLHKFNVLKKITKSKAKELLLGCDLIGYELFPKSVKESIENIIGKDDTKEKKIEPEIPELKIEEEDLIKTEEVIEVNAPEAIEEIAVEETPVVKESKTKRTNQYKKSAKR